MATIKKVEFTYKKGDLRRDANGLYIGYQVDVRSAKKRHRNIFRTKREAEDFIDALKEQGVYRAAGMKKTAGKIPLVSEVFDRRLEQIKNRAEKVRAKRVFAAFLTVFEYPVDITAVRSSHFGLYINARLADGVKPESINREINILSSAISRAPEMYPAALEDFEAPKVVRPRFKQRRRERIITPDENTVILAWLYREQEESDRKYANRIRIARMWHLAWLLGLRYSEITHLLKTDFKGRTLRVVRQKTGNVTIFDALPDEAVELLEKAVASSETEYILSLTGSTPTTFYKILKEAVEQAGLTWGREGIDSVTFHSLRHSFITRLVQVTDIATAASFSGHTHGSEMIPLYSHASPDSRRKAMAAMYGKKDVKRLSEIYERVRSGEMDLEAFVASFE